MKKPVAAVLKIVLSLAVSALCLYFAFQNVEWEKLKSILAGARGGPLLLSVFISFLTFWLRATRWKMLLDPFQKVPTMTLLRWQVGGLLVNNLLPLRAGELARGYWTGHKTSISKTTAFSTIVVERLLDLFSLALIAVVLLAALGFYKLTKLQVGGLVVGLFVAGFIAKTQFQKIKEIANTRLKNLLPGKLHSIYDRFAAGLQILQDGKEVLKVAALSVLIWSVDITVLMTVARSLNLFLTWPQAGMTIVGLILGVMLPAAPGAVGTYEAGGVQALTLLGFEKTLSLSFVLLLHGLQYLLILFIGIPILFFEGFNPKALFQDAQENPDQPGQN